MSQIEVALVDTMGSDLSVVNAARVSFDKSSDWNYWRDEDGSVRTYLKDADKKLIAYLAKHNHWSPFAHTFLSFRIKAPIFVARQLVKHQVGLAWNEVSRRYVDSPPEFYMPDGWRKRAENVKQGSSNETVLWLDREKRVATAVAESYRHSRETYHALLAAGICPEQARMVLPQSMMTEWIWSGSLYAFSRVCKLRLDAHAQQETQVVAKLIAEDCEYHFPVSWKELLSV
jgi:thymidylate synthase (FAD)